MGKVTAVATLDLGVFEFVDDRCNENRFACMVHDITCFSILINCS